VRKRRSPSLHAIGGTCKFFRNSRGWTKLAGEKTKSSASSPARAKDFTERDKAALQNESSSSCSGLVLPAYREAAQRGQIEISTTPFYHPILPCSAIRTLRAWQIPETPLPSPRFPPAGRCARANCGAPANITRRVFGADPAGLWPRRAPSPTKPLTIAMKKDFSGLAQTRVSLAARSKSAFSATPSGPPRKLRAAVQALSRAVSGKLHQRIIPPITICRT